MNLMASEQLKSMRDLLMRRLLPFRDSIMVVQLLRPVQAEPDIKIFLGEKLASFLVYRRAIGLNTIDNFFAFRKMLFLELHRFAEKLDAKQRRLAAMPGEADDLLRRPLDVLNDVAFEGLIAQAKVRALRIKLFFL
jgi:hypothetical protein